MTYVLDCITLFLIVILCVYLLYDKYPLRKTYMLRRTVLVISVNFKKCIRLPVKRHMISTVMSLH